MSKKVLKVYLASGWFTEVQKKLMEEIYEVLTFRADVELFAPFYNGIVLKPDAPREEWKKVFELDVNMIGECDLMVANIEDFEPGTIFETGVAYKSNVPVIAYSSVKGRGLNLMLAQSCIGFANSRDELRNHVDTFVKDPTIERINRWEGEPI